MYSVSYPLVSLFKPLNRLFDLLMVHILNFNTLTNVRQQRHGESTSEMFREILEDRQ